MEMLFRTKKDSVGFPVVLSFDKKHLTFYFFFLSGFCQGWTEDENRPGDFPKNIFKFSLKPFKIRIPGNSWEIHPGLVSDFLLPQNFWNSIAKCGPTGKFPKPSPLQPQPLWGLRRIWWFFPKTRYRIMKKKKKDALYGKGDNKKQLSDNKKKILLLIIALSIKI